ncbi:MAG: DNA-directed RNA polymerase subunit alpha [Candidatus Sungbacteria bacterium]|nr:DNA-directed RNA polymerase subunit alpha [Candidatus Sungbacteria bacterium]
MIPLPSKPNVIFEQDNKAIFEVSGLYPGYGQTIGNSMRRALLSSLQGAVITSVKIEGVGHEFSSLDGVMEDIVELTLNLKQLRFKMFEDGPFTITLDVQGEQAVTGADFQAPSQVELINKQMHVATLTSKKALLRMEAVVESGLGYVPVEARNKEKVEVGTIALDASFSPVRHVNYEIENMRVGGRTDYNLVRFEIETDGSLTPREAFEQAGKILVEQFQALAAGFTEIETRSERHRAVKPARIEEVAASEKMDDDGESESVLKMKLDELKISSRALNALREVGIKTVGGLARKREESLREVEGLGEKGIQEIKKALGNFGISLKQK